jgi:hypothetical protein
MATIPKYMIVEVTGLASGAQKISSDGRTADRDVEDNRDGTAQIIISTRGKTIFEARVALPRGMLGLQEEIISRRGEDPRRDPPSAKPISLTVLNS